jgi:hypothetical protein
MAFPRELRDLVYSHIISDLSKIINVSNDRLLAPTFQLSNQTIIGGSSQHPLVTFLPGIAYINNHIYNEFVPAYLRHIYLKISDTPDLLYLENFFDTLPRDNGWHKINNLTLLDVASLARTPGRANEVMDTILHAPNLKVVVLNFKLCDFYLPPDWPFLPESRAEAVALQSNPPRVVDAEYLMTEYQFARLFGLRELRRLIVKIEHGFFEHTPRSIGVVADLKATLMAGLGREAGVSEVSCQVVDIRRPGISVFILRVERQ